MKVKAVTFIAICTRLIPLFGYTQAITATGQVIDKYEKTVVWGATVMVKGNSESAVHTDENGYYSINVKPDALLVVYFIGHTTQEIAVGGRTLINVEMDCGDCRSYITSNSRNIAHVFLY
ncbi:MAG: carboxypeptidase-like regulatory domain-containing protein [Prevotellaceae bacterium]|jgi:hypothetical protein|nr:carboxypeptidase-like regulatory domain-containing protein [Prevotellaceae bacterium]